MLRDRSLIEKWLGKEAQTQPSEQNVRQDRYDKTIWNEIQNNSSKIRQLKKQGTSTFPALLRDFWASFYKTAPELEDEKTLSTTHQINRPFVEKLLEDRQTQEARITTMLDELSSAIAAAHAGEQMVRELNEREELRQAMEQAEAAKKMEQAGDEEGAQTAMKEALEKLDGAARDVRRAVRQSIQTGQEKAEQVQQAMAGWGMETADLKSIPIGDRLELAETITRHDLRRIADLVGRMRNLARAKQRSKVKQRRDEIHSITIGNKLQHVLPQEMSALTHPMRRLDFYRRFSEGQLLQYDLRGEEKLAKGPMVAMVDVSGSMRGAPLEWAVACALALADTAHRQKRHCRIMFFNTEVQAEFDFAPGEKDVEKYLQMAQMSSGGGTDYTPALKKATQLIAGNKKQNKAYEHADMIMITDGLCQLEPDALERFIQWKKDNKSCCYTILIGYDELDDLNRWNDKTWRLTALDSQESGDDVAGKLFEEI